VNVHFWRSPPPAAYAYPNQIDKHSSSLDRILTRKERKMSGHCHDEHDHSHGGHSHEGHDHSDDITPALQYSLYQHINFDDITTFNESEAHSGKAVVKKTWAERLNEQPELESDADEQLLMHIPLVLPRHFYPSKPHLCDTPS
jgi:hypothetical protein